MAAKRNQADLDVKYFLRRRGAERRGFWLMCIVCIVLPVLNVLTNPTWRGMRHIPLTGGVILASNHISHADPMPVAHFVHNAGRNPRFLAKASIFKLRLLGSLLRAAGQVPVHRGGADAVKSLHSAIEIINQGGAVIVYPEGTTSKQPQHWPMRGRTGVARLAMETGAPVIPMAMWGPQRLYDPVGKKRRLRPRTPVTMVAGEPVDLSPWDGAEPDTATLEAMTEAIMLRIRDQLAETRGETPPELFDLKAAESAGEDENA